LMMALYMDKVPASWARWAWPSLRALTPWLSNFIARLQQLEEWSNNPADIPKVTWLSGLYNPQSFLTAICQVTAQKDKEELDKLVTQTDIQTKMTVEEIDSSPKDGRGAYIHGLSLQGARWDLQSKTVEKSKPKEMFCPMPVILVRGVKADKADSAAYQCPCYKTEQRGPTYVFCAQLKTKSPPARWVLAGVGLILDVSS
jgi:dynein heavy chain